MGKIIEIVKEEEVEGFTKGPGLVKILIDQNKTASQNIELGKFYLKPNSKTIPNTHPHSEEAFFILKGEGSMWAGGETSRVTEGDGIYIPANIEHYFESKEEGLEFLLILSPPE